VRLKAAILWIWFLVAPASQTGSGQEATAQEQFNRGDYRDAIETLSSAISRTPKDARLYFLRSRCYLELGDFRKALSDGKRAVRLNPNDSEFHFWLASAYGAEAERVHSLRLALRVRQEYEKAIRLEPSNIQARRDLMMYDLQVPGILGGGVDKALQEIQAIMAMDSVAGHLARADYWRAQKQPDKAAAEYQLVLALKPGHIGPYLEAADFYQERGDADGLARVVAQATPMTPLDELDMSYYRAVGLVIAGKGLDEADRLLHEYMARAPQRRDFPSHAIVHVWLGRLNERRGRMKEAVQEYHSALSLEPKLESAREGLQRAEAGATGVGAGP